jgi:acetyl-CoA acetyltransferase
MCWNPSATATASTPVRWTTSFSAASIRSAKPAPFIPRSAAFEAGYDMKAPGMQLSRFCASGLDAINLGAAKIAQGADEIVIAGGVESMSRVGMGASGGSWFMDPSVGLPGLLSCRRAFRPT